MAKSEYTMLEVAGREVRLSNPAKVYFPKPGWTKLDLVDVLPGRAPTRCCIHLRERPTVMKRFVNGIMEDPIWQKRVPEERARLAADGDGRVPVRADRRGARRQRRGAPRRGRSTSA